MFLTRRYVLFFVLTFLIIPQAVKPQTDPEPFKLKSRIEVPAGTVIGHVLPLDDGKKILVIADGEARIWDVEKGTLIRSYPNNFAFGVKRFVETLKVSPDGSKLISIEKLSGDKYRSAIVSDLATGKETKLTGTLDETRHAQFSKNGKVIFTIHGDLKDIELRFWDAETLKLRNSIRVKDLGWYRLSDDGERIIIANGKAIKWLNHDVMRYAPSPSIDLLDTTTGKTSTLFQVRNASSPQPIEPYPEVSSDEKHLAGVSNRKIFVWETNGSGSPKYEISSINPKIRLNLLGFSPDGRYLMASEGRRIGRLYEAGTGKLVREFKISDGDYKVSQDSRWAIIHAGTGLMLYLAVDDPKRVFGVSLSKEQESSDPANADPFAGQEFEIESAEMSPNGKFVVVSGAKRISLTDAGTGKVQSLVDLTAVSYDDKGKVKDTGLNDDMTGWLDGGDAIYAISKDARSCLIWSVK